MKALWQLSHTDLERSSPDFIAEYRRRASTDRLVLACEPRVKGLVPQSDADFGILL
jgi:hypothetical protein